MADNSSQKIELQREILTFWFGEDPDEAPLERAQTWFRSDSAFDEEVRQRFRKHTEAAGRGLYDNWRDQPESCLAFIILLDQFPRNIYRGTPRAFAFDEMSLSASLDGQSRGFDEELRHVERWFFYMPMQHAEDLAIQRRSVERYRALAEEAPPSLEDALQEAYEYAVEHKEAIERFGRFPHRNDVLGRSSTPEEADYLEAGGGFG